MLRIEVDEQPEATIVRIAGDADMASSTDLREVILDLLNHRVRDRLLVNMAKADYIDSSAVASLVEGLQVAARRKIRFGLVAVNEGPLQVLRITRLIDVFELHDSEEDALRA